MPSPYDPTPLHPAPDPAAWAAYERANRRAADEYDRRVARAALPGCAGDCGTAVWSEGGLCFECRRAGAA